LGGKNSYSYDEIIDIFGKALGKGKVSKLHHPLALMKPAVKILQNIPQFPIASDQLAMLLEGNVCDPTEWAGTFDIEPEDFAEGVKKAI
ncbi:MAG: complex I NDUFA9 subunit family protein, partial [Desulfuromonadales bacterium]|nr:complex I NDUFA9 subunit family protein [Desulfuromonadales bacterium]NIS42495.1 complex I NDUFA9 subunit family protein [Desulfuromonadales bacterium]